MSVKVYTIRFMLVISFTILFFSPTYGKENETSILYGNNSKEGQFIKINGIKLYYERYAKGTPILMIHGNSKSIRSMRYQIDYFSKDYQVLAADNRGHGKSEMGKGRLTYEQIAEDFNVLLEKLNIQSAMVLGWSDGGIIGLLLAMKHPDKVSKLAIMGTNIRPDGVYNWAYDKAKIKLEDIDLMISQGSKSIKWQTKRQYLGLLVEQPNISINDLNRLKAPTLVMAGDKDVIRNEHTLEIFEALPNAQLCIFPGATHIIPHSNPELFNQTVANFFAKPFSRPDTKNLF